MKNMVKRLNMTAGIWLISTDPDTGKLRSIADVTDWSADEVADLADLIRDLTGNLVAIKRIY